MDTLTFEIPAEHFRQLCAQMKKRLQISLPQVVRGEAGAIAKTMATRTSEAKPAKLRSRVLQRSISETTDEITISSGLRRADAKGRVWYHPHGAVVQRGINAGRKAFYFMGHLKYPRLVMPTGGRYYPQRFVEFAPLFDAIKQVNASNLAAAQAHIGLTKATWVKVAEDIGFGPLKIAYLPPRTKRIKPRVYALASKMTGISGALTSGRGDTIGITLYNSSIIATRRDRDLFRRVVSGRQKYLLRNLREGFAQSAKSVAAKYPWVDVV